MATRNIPISQFKSKCSRLIEEVHKTRQPLRITRHRRPLVEIVPIQPRRKRKFLGDMVGTAVILGDIVSPVIDLPEFET